MKLTTEEAKDRLYKHIRNYGDANIAVNDNMRDDGYPGLYILVQKKGITQWLKEAFAGVDNIVEIRYVGTVRPLAA